MQTLIRNETSTDTSDGESIGEYVQVEDILNAVQRGAYIQPADSPSGRRTSANLLVHVLISRQELNLTAKVTMGVRAERYGGFADVFKGYLTETNEVVAVKRLRLEMDKSEKLAKAGRYR